VAELWAPFADNLERWIDSMGPTARLVRGVTPPEQEQAIIDALARRDPAAIPWKSADDSPYVYGVAATVSIPEKDLPRALRSAVSYGLKFSPNMPWHVEPLGMREGAYEIPGVPKGKFRGYSAKEGAGVRASDAMGRALDKSYGRLHYADETVVEASRQLNQRNIPLADQAKRFLRTMGKVTSNNNYDWIDPKTGGVGRWQIRPKDWKAWTTEVFGNPIPLKKDRLGNVTPPPRQIQDRLAAGMANKMYDIHKDWGKVADVWRTGKSTKADTSFRKIFRSAWVKEAHFARTKPEQEEQ